MALSTGDRLALPGEVKDSFRRAGMAHLLAISGLHVAGLAAVAYMLISMSLGRVQRLAVHGGVKAGASVVAILVAWLYCLMAGATPATVRAAVLVTTYLGTNEERKQPDLLNGLGHSGERSNRHVVSAVVSQPS